MKVTVRRNSGATLTPVIMKTGGYAVGRQGMKMHRYPVVFAPVLSLYYDDVEDTDTEPTGYFMPMLEETADVAAALELLPKLWHAERNTPYSQLPVDTRERYHMHTVLPLCPPELVDTLALWAKRSRYSIGRAISVVHGDATLENVMQHNGRVCWIDPSTRAVPPEAEIDVAKLLQCYFGYGEGISEQAQATVRAFATGGEFDRDLTGYYLVTHLVRLYGLQPQARRWALQLASNLEAQMEELWTCR